MKSIVLVALAFVAVTLAAPFEEKKPVPQIVQYESKTYPDGSYAFSYQTDDGSGRQETGVVKEALDEENKLQKVITISGSYTFLDAEGRPDTITYFADETGYHAEGKSVPRVVQGDK